jgi:hypothetical protein
MNKRKRTAIKIHRKKTIKRKEKIKAAKAAATTTEKS